MRRHLIFTLITVLLTLPAAASAHEGLEVTNVWSRATPPSIAVGAAYFTAENHAGAPDTLIAVASPVAERVEMHTHIMQDGMMMMRQLETIGLPPGGTLEFKPGGNHIMLIGLDHALEEGERFPLTLKFEHAGRIEVIVEVRGLGG